MGLPLPVLKITDEREPTENKKVVVVTGRIHPGETNGSIVLAGSAEVFVFRGGGSS
jgi:hypothetical protein